MLVLCLILAFQETVTLFQPGELGQLLIVSATVFEEDGTTPVVGAKVYIFNTDAQGDYGPEGNANPRLKAETTTDAAGRFRFRTIRPGAYPQGGVPAHIHVHITRGTQVHQTEIHFKDDPQLRPGYVAAELAKGALSHVVDPQLGKEAMTCDWAVRLPKP